MLPARGASSSKGTLPSARPSQECPAQPAMQFHQIPPGRPGQLRAALPTAVERWSPLMTSQRLSLGHPGGATAHANHRIIKVLGGLHSVGSYANHALGATAT